MRLKVNPHTIRGRRAIRDLESRWNPDVDLIIENFNKFLVLNSDKFRNLQVSRNFGIYGFNSCGVERFVKTMKKR